MQECPTLLPKSPSQKFLTFSQMRIWQQNCCRIHIQCDVKETPLPKFNAYCDSFVWSKTEITSRPNKLTSQDLSCVESLPHAIPPTTNPLRWWGIASCSLNQQTVKLCHLVVRPGYPYSDHNALSCTSRYAVCTASRSWVLFASKFPRVRLGESWHSTEILFGTLLELWSSTFQFISPHKSSMWLQCYLPSSRPLISVTKSLEIIKYFSA